MYVAYNLQFTERKPQQQQPGNERNESTKVFACMYTCGWYDLNNEYGCIVPHKKKPSKIAVYQQSVRECKPFSKNV